MPKHTAPPGVSRNPVGVMEDGTAVERFTVRAGTLSMEVITLGATIVSLRAPDRDGVVDDVVLGFDKLDDYVHRSPYFGAVVGRFANRIARGRFILDGEPHQLAVNNGAHHLHGGVRGFDKHVWSAELVEGAECAGVVLTRVSPDGEEGYPGTLTCRVEYLLTTRNELSVRYRAEPDRATIVNLTQHSYFDLSAGAAPDIGGHVLSIHADSFTPVDAGLIPTGELRGVAGTPFDFREPTSIGARLGAPDDQLRHAGGYDHNFVLRRRDGHRDLVHAARVLEPGSGRTLDVHTTEPGMQFYSGNFLDGSVRGKEGRVYAHRTGFCLETQHFPDSPNQPSFPSVVLRPGAVYQSRTVYTFGTA